jgi:PTH1 family peptidyl-tRNA hydrolase
MPAADAEETPLSAVIGLGNPGPGYENTRHNVGARVLHEVLMTAGGSLPQGDIVRAARTSVEGRRIWLARTATYMNASGPAVSRWARDQELAPRELLIVCDDLDLPLGRIRLRRGGGTGGHRGLESLVAALGTDAFPRLRLGIGKPPEDVDAADYVLQPVPEEESESLQSVVEWAADAVRLALREGVTRAMNTFNGAPGPPGWVESGGEGGD